jgi:hypothetical protein
MGHTHVTVTVSNLQKSMPAYTRRFSWIRTPSFVWHLQRNCAKPGSSRKAGRPTGWQTARRSNATMVSRESSFMGSDTVTKIIFGPDKVEPLLGVTALESVGIGVDPVTQTRKRYAALPLKVQRSPRELTP